jgi:hypothetical protein
MAEALENTPEQAAALAARPADVPVVMVNLLKFKTPGGLESYLHYAREVAPHLNASAQPCATVAQRRPSSLAKANGLGGMRFSSSSTRRRRRSSTW